jgi:hypothetical protein
VTVVPTLLITLSIVSENETIMTYELDYWKVFRYFSIYRLEQVFVRHNATLGRVYFRLAFWLTGICMLFSFSMLMVENRFCITEVQKREARGIKKKPWEEDCPTEKFVFH